MPSGQTDGVDLIMRGAMILAAATLATVYFAGWHDEAGAYLFVFALIVLVAGALRS